MATGRAEARYALKADDRTQEGLRSAETRLQRFTRRGVMGLAAAFSRVAVPVAAVGAAITAWGRSVSRTATKLDDLAKRAKDVGETVSSMAEADLAAELLGTDPQRMIRWFEQIQEKAFDAKTGVKEAADAFARAGIDAQALSDMDMAETFETAAAALERLSGSERVAVRRDLGLTGRGAGRVFGQGREAISEAFGRGELLEVGEGLDKAAAHAEEFNDHMAEVGAQLKNAWANFTGPGEWFVDMARRLSGHVAVLRGVEQRRFTGLTPTSVDRALRDPTEPKEETQSRQLTELRKLNAQIAKMVTGYQ